MRLKFPFFFLSCLYALTGQAQLGDFTQQQNYLKANSHWVIEGSDIDFNTNPPTVNDSIDFVMMEGMATASDPVTGELLFYSPGTKCVDRNNQVMPNGDSLLGNGAGGFVGSTTQGICIVPMIDSPGKYYLFSLNGPTDGMAFTAGGSLFYSIVDMSLNNTMGDIVQGRKNILLDTDSLSESMIAIPGDNCDIWLMVHHASKDQFKAYHITRDGIDPNPVLSQTGGDHLPNLNFAAAASNLLGGMSVSPDRQRLAISLFFPLCYGYVDSMTGVLLCKFDPATGLVSDAIQIEKDRQGYIPAFSPDNSKLYLTHFDHLNDSNFIYQYDITSHDPALIDASRQTIASVNTGMPYLRSYGDKIYVTDSRADTAPPFTRYYLSTINQPNLPGALSDFQFGTIPVLKHTNTLPNEVVYPVPPDSLHRLTLDTFVCAGGSGILLKPQFLAADYQYEWSDGSSDTVLNIDAVGTYWVRYTNGCHQYTDSFRLQQFDFVSPVINVDSFRLSTTMPYASYQWLLNGVPIPNATDDYIDVTENGDYQVIVSDGTCTDTSAIYKVTNHPTGIPSIPSLTDKIRIYPNPASERIVIEAPIKVDVMIYGQDGRSIRSVENANELRIHDLAAGMYYLHIFDRNGVLIKVEKIVRLKSE